MQVSESVVLYNAGHTPDSFGWVSGRPDRFKSRACMFLPRRAEGFRWVQGPARFYRGRS